MLSYENEYCGATAGSAKNAVVGSNCRFITHNFAAILAKIETIT